MFPVVKSHAAAQPLIKVSDIAKRDSNDVVVHCSTKIGLQVGDDFHGRVTSRPFGQSPHFGFELLLAFLSPSDFLPDDPEAKEGRFLERNDFAFGFVDDEFEGFLQVAFDACQDALTRSRASAQNNKIIGLPDEEMSSFLKFVVQLIEQDIGQ